MVQNHLHSHPVHPNLKSNVMLLPRYPRHKENPEGIQNKVMQFLYTKFYRQYVLSKKGQVTLLSSSRLLPQLVGIPALNLLVFRAKVLLPENDIRCDKKNSFNGQAVAQEISAFQSLKKNLF